MTEKPERQKYDPAQPYSFCQTCLKLGWTRKRNGRWLCAKCTKSATEREAVVLAGTKQSLNRP